MVLVTVKTAFEMPVSRPRKTGGGGGGVVRVVSELGVFQSVTGLMSLRPVLVPCKIQNLLGWIMQIGGEFAFPVGHGGILNDRLAVVAAADVRGRGRERTPPSRFAFVLMAITVSECPLILRWLCREGRSGFGWKQVKFSPKGADDLNRRKQSKQKQRALRRFSDASNLTGRVRLLYAAV